MSNRSMTLIVAFLLALLGLGYFRVGVTRTASLDELRLFQTAFLVLAVTTTVSLLASLIGDAVEFYRWRKLIR